MCKLFKMSNIDDVKSPHKQYKLTYKHLLKLNMYIWKLAFFHFFCYLSTLRFLAIQVVFSVNSSNMNTFFKRQPNYANIVLVLIYSIHMTQRREAVLTFRLKSVHFIKENPFSSPRDIKLLCINYIRLHTNFLLTILVNLIMHIDNVQNP